ncbi:MAG: hypothetical protein N2C14_33115, partial [Planctomycetales bacterium]
PVPVRTHGLPLPNVSDLLQLCQHGQKVSRRLTQLSGNLSVFFAEQGFWVASQTESRTCILRFPKPRHLARVLKLLNDTF